MWWLIFVLICSSFCVAQPNGPFELVTVGSAESLGESKVVIDNSGIAYVWYVENDAGTFTLKYVSVNATSGTIINASTAVLESDSGSLRVEDVALDANGEPLVLAINQSGMNHHLQFIRNVASEWVATTLYTVSDQFFVPCGLLHSDLQNSNFVALGNEVIQILTHETGMGCPGFPEPYSQPVVCFYENPEAFDVVVMYEAGNFDWSPAPQGFEITPDSMHVWSQMNSRFAVNRAGFYERIQYYDCDYGELAGIRLRDEVSVFITGMTLCIPPCLVFLRFEDSDCAVIGEIHTMLGMTPSVSVYENYGFVIPTYDFQHIELMRVDTNAQVAAQTGTIAWYDGAASITDVVAGVSPEGLIATVWKDRNPETGTARLWLASCDWLTPLDSRESLAPIPQSISLTAYPNPFNASVQIEYELPRAGEVELSIYNTLGQQVATLFNGRVTAGAHALNWSPDAASGVYFVKLVSGDFVTSRKILYIR